MGFFRTLGDLAEMAVAPVKDVAENVSNAFGLETPEEKREREHDREVEKKELELKILRERNRKKK